MLVGGANLSFSQVLQVIFLDISLIFIICHIEIINLKGLFSMIGNFLLNQFVFIRF